jgi:hypothetical protein
MGQAQRRRVLHRERRLDPFLALAHAFRMASWLRGGRSCCLVGDEMLDWLAVEWCADEVHGVNAGGVFRQLYGRLEK